MSILKTIRVWIDLKEKNIILLPEMEEYSIREYRLVIEYKEFCNTEYYIRYYKHKERCYGDIWEVHEGGEELVVDTDEYNVVVFDFMKTLREQGECIPDIQYDHLKQKSR